MTGKDATDDVLDALFAEASARAPDPLPISVNARLLAAALEAQPRPARRPGLWTRMRAALAEIGGAPGLAGVGVAGLAGLWIGFAGPAGTGTLVSDFWQGAASVAPGLAAYVGDSSASDSASSGAADLLSLIDGDIQ